MSRTPEPQAQDISGLTDEELDRRMGARLADAMAAKGVSQTDVANAVGVSQSYMSRLLKGERSISTKRLSAIAAFLGVSMDTLMDEACGETADHYDRYDCVAFESFLVSERHDISPRQALRLKAAATIMKLGFMPSMDWRALKRAIDQVMPPVSPSECWTTHERVERWKRKVLETRTEIALLESVERARGALRSHIHAALAKHRKLMEEAEKFREAAKIIANAEDPQHADAADYMIQRAEGAEADAAQWMADAEELSRELVDFDREHPSEFRDADREGDYNRVSEDLSATIYYDRLARALYKEAKDSRAVKPGNERKRVAVTPSPPLPPVAPENAPPAPGWRRAEERLASLRHKGGS